MKKEKYSVQEWLPFQEIYEKGIILLKNGALIKILKVIPINYNLKSDLEKEAILNSYQLFLKTCNFNMQLLIQSNKEDLSKHISKIQQRCEEEKNSNLLQISKNYCHFIQSKNQEKKSSSKNFYIILKKIPEKNQEKELIKQDLSDYYFKVKECLSRCGNLVVECETKKEIETILESFFTTRKYWNKE